MPISWKLIKSSSSADSGETGSDDGDTADSDSDCAMTIDRYYCNNKKLLVAVRGATQEIGDKTGKARLISAKTVRLN